MSVTNIDTGLHRIKSGEHSKMIFVLDKQIAYPVLQDIAEIINVCVKNRVVVTNVQMPGNTFIWENEDGTSIEVNNYFQNKAIFHFAPESVQKTESNAP